LVLDYLVYSYRIFEEKDAIKYIEHLVFLQRMFVSALFEEIVPRRHRKQVKKFTSVKIKKDLRFEHFIKDNPDKLSNFFNF
ncbi:MAG: hypothetical protein R3Y24_04125, partial [Eubacteriales bacterium]